MSSPPPGAGALEPEHRPDGEPAGRETEKGPPDRGFCHMIVHACLRHRSYLRRGIGSHGQDGQFPPPGAARMALAGLETIHMTGIWISAEEPGVFFPGRAAVDGFGAVFSRFYQKSQPGDQVAGDF